MHATFTWTCQTGDLRELRGAHALFHLVESTNVQVGMPKVLMELNENIKT